MIIKNELSDIAEVITRALSNSRVDNIKMMLQILKNDFADVSNEIHEINRELNYSDQQMRIFQTLNKSKHGNERNG